MSEPNPYPTWVEVNLSAIEGNVRAIRKLTGVDFMAVVKANGYGHGAVEVSRAALRAGAAWLGVHRYAEAHDLRDAGINAPVLVFGMITPDEIDRAIAENITLTLYSHELAEVVSQRAAAVGRTASVHIKVDTGMGRLGVLPGEAVSLAQRAAGLGNIYIDGVFSHFAMADSDGHPLTDLQVLRFNEVLGSLHEAGFDPRWVHMANTGGTLNRRDAWYNMVRPGSGLYGIWHIHEVPYPEYLTPAMTWKSRLEMSKCVPAGWGISYGQLYTLTQDEWIGVVPVGYADGYRRRYGVEMLVGGRRVPVRGTICMDQCMVSLDHAYPYGEEVVVMGKQGEAEITLPEIAHWWQTSQLDVVTGITARVHRVYTRDEA